MHSLCQGCRPRPRIALRLLVSCLGGAHVSWLLLLLGCATISVVPSPQGWTGPASLSPECTARVNILLCNQVSMWSKSTLRGPCSSETTGRIAMTVGYCGICHLSMALMRCYALAEL